MSDTPNALEDALVAAHAVSMVQDAEGRDPYLLALSQGQDFEPALIGALARHRYTEASDAIADLARLVTWAYEEFTRRPEKTAGWLTWCEDYIGLGRTIAYRWLTCGRKLFANGTPPSKLLGIGSSRVLEIVTELDDEEVATLISTGDVRGVTVDQIEQMSVRALKRHLRETRLDRDRTRAKLDEAAKDRARLLEENHVLRRGLDERELTAAIRKLEARVASVTDEAAHLIENTMWTDAQPSSRAAMRGFLRSLRSLYDDLHHNLEGRMPLDVEVIDVGGAVVLSADARAMLAELDDGFSLGELVDFATFGAGGSWSLERRLQVARDLAAHGYLLPDPDGSGSAWVMNHESAALHVELEPVDG